MFAWGREFSRFFFSLSLTVMAGYRLIEVAAFAVGGGLEVCSGESR